MTRKIKADPIQITSQHYGNVMRDLAGRNGIYAKEPLNMKRVQVIVQEKIAAL